MGDQDMTRRTLLKGGGAALAGMTVLRVAGPASAFPGSGDEEDEAVVPWLDQPTTDPSPGPPPQLVWEELDSWITPNDEFFVVSTTTNLRSRPRTGGWTSPAWSPGPCR